MIVKHRLNLDLTKRGVAQRIDAVQNDCYSRQLELHLHTNGITFSPPEDCTVLVRYKKPDGTGGAYDTLPDGACAWEIADGSVTVALAPQVCTVAGTVELAVSLMQENAEISTFAVLVDVQEAPGGTETSREYVNIKAFLPQPENVTVGQYLMVTGVDDNGNATVIGSSAVGKSAYAYAKEGGYPGTEAEFAAKLAYDYADDIQAVAKKLTPRNLLDNSDFTDPVNQRGQTSYSGAAQYTIDRWRTWDDSISVNINSGGIAITNAAASAQQFVQYQDEHTTSLLTGKSLTFACAMANGEIYTVTGTGGSTANNSAAMSSAAGCFLQLSTGNGGLLATQIFVPAGSTTNTIAWAALYEGEYTADTLPAYQAKGYALELTECQRYYYRIPKGVVTGYITTNATEFYSDTIEQIVNMRTTPTAALSGTMIMRTVSGYSTATGFTTGSGGNVSLLSSVAVSTLNDLKIVFADAASSVNNSPCAISFNNPIELSADL